CELFLESEIESTERREAGSRHDVSRMRLVEVITVCQIVEVDLRADVFGDDLARHRVEHPIARNLLHKSCRRIKRHRGTCRSAVHKLRSTAYGEFPWQKIRGPQVEGVLGHIRQLCSNRIGKG